MPKVKMAWRFRKHSESDPILTKECGCKYYCYDGTIVRYCEKHHTEHMAELSKVEASDGH